MRVGSIYHVLKAKLDKTVYANLFNITILSAMLYTSEIWATIRKKEQWQRSMERDILGISLGEQIQTKVMRKESNCHVLKTEVPLGWTSHKVYLQQVDPCSC